MQTSQKVKSTERKHIQQLLISILIVFPVIVLILSSSIRGTLQGAGSAVGNFGTGGTEVSGSGTGTGALFHTSGAVPSRLGGSVTATGIAVIGSSSSAWAYLFLVLGIGVFTTLIFYGSMVRKSKKRSTLIRPKTQPNDASFLLIIGLTSLFLIGLAAWLASKISSPVFQFPSIGINSAQELQLVLIFVFIAAILASVYVLHKRASKIRISHENLHLRNPQGELKQIFDHTIRKLEEDNGSYRFLIIDCYRQVLEFFARWGLPQSPNITTREFEKQITELIGFPSAPLQELTIMFEKAKYSDEELSSQDVAQAKESLRKMSSLEKELEKIPVLATRAGPQNIG